MLLRHFRNFRYPGLVFSSIGFASILHVCWASGLFFDANSAPITGIHILVHTFGGSIPATVAMLLFTSSLALVGLLLPIPYMIGCILPQQLLLLLSSLGVIMAMVNGHQPTGEIVTWHYILADKVNVILITAQYAIGVMLSGIDDVA